MNLVEIGSQTAKDGFRNEEDIVEKYNVWKKVLNTTIRNCTLILFFIIGNSLMSQNIIIQQDNKILELIELHQKANLRINYLDGYRVQIFFDSGANSHQNANRTKTNFASKYPEVPVYLIFKEPNFRVRVGDFRTRHEARGFLVKIIAEYPNAFVIKDQINFPALENKKPEEIKE